MVFGKKSNNQDEAQKDESNDSAVEPGKKKVKYGLRLKISLAIIMLVTVIIGIMTFYFIQEEAELLKNQIMQFAERETEHLATIARESISQQDELPLVAAIRNLNEVDFIAYAYVIDPRGQIIQNFDPSLNGQVLEDDITKKSMEYSKKDEPLIQSYPDDQYGGSIIYDISIPLFHVVFNQRIGTVRIGFSNIVIQKQVAKMTRNISLIGLVFLALSVAGSIMLASVIIKPLKKLTAGAAIIGTGNLDYKIDMTTTDELGLLAKEFNDMTDQLKKAREMEIESRIMEEQLELAREIQEGLNPMDFYNKGGVQIKGYTRAARGVGGDYFDYIDIDSTKVGALISDVAGKGIPASLVMVMIRTVFTSYVNRGEVECGPLVKAINDSLSADFAIDKFVTLFFMIYDRTRHELSFSNAGHGPLFCYRASLKACTITKLDNVPIGIMDDVDYGQARVKMDPGDTVVMYTDGITEMRNEDREEYGAVRLQKMIMTHTDLDANELVETIVDDVEKFRGDVLPHDDMTLLVLKRSS
jgi:serine phosphatase RsbU (regulator of sigma subunit)